MFPLTTFKLQDKMAASPYLSSDLKAYLRKFEIEPLINRTVNDLCRAMPEDPFAFLVGELQKMASPTVELLSVSAVEVVSGEGFPLLKLKAKVRYLSKELTVALPQPISILSEENMLYDEDRLGGKGLQKCLKLLGEKLGPRLAGLKCEQQEEIDREVEKGFAESGGQGVYAVTCLSYLPLLLRSQLLATPPYALVAQQAGIPHGRTIKTMINCLQGGKAIGSKCKVFKYYLVARQVADPALLQAALQGVRKAIVGGKGGEAALKVSPDGTFICPLDTIADNLKIMEEAIAGCGGKEQLGIGLSWAADSLFVPESKKYELENPKTPFDNDQMIDYLFKLLQEKPAILYLEDPLASSEKTAWRKLIGKIRDNQSTKHVKVGTRSGKLLSLHEPNLKAAVGDLSVDQTADSHPETTQEARTAANALKFKLDVVQIRAYELKTLSNLLRAHRELRRVKTELLLQDCAYEGYDGLLVDLSVGLDCFSNLGSIAKFDRLSKLNRMREILEDFKQDQ